MAPLWTSSNSSMGTQNLDTLLQVETHKGTIHTALVHFSFSRKKKNTLYPRAHATRYQCEFTTCLTSSVVLQCHYLFSDQSPSKSQLLQLVTKMKGMQCISVKSVLLRLIITCVPTSPELIYHFILAASKTKNLYKNIHTYICVNMYICFLYTNTWSIHINRSQEYVYF